MSFLLWNVRGINSKQKWDAVHDKILESSASIVYLQETKQDFFDDAYIKKLCPRHLDKFVSFPSVGASSGLLIVWNSGLYDETLVRANSYSVTIKL